MKGNTKKQMGKQTQTVVCCGTTFKGTKTLQCFWSLDRFPQNSVRVVLFSLCNWSSKLCSKNSHLNVNPGQNTCAVHWNWNQNEPCNPSKLKRNRTDSTTNDCLSNSIAEWLNDSKTFTVLNYRGLVLFPPHAIAMLGVHISTMAYCSYWVLKVLMSLCLQYWRTNTRNSPKAIPKI